MSASNKVVTKASAFAINKCNSQNFTSANELDINISLYLIVSIFDC